MSFELRECSLNQAKGRKQKAKGQLIIVQFLMAQGLAGQRNELNDEFPHCHYPEWEAF